MKKSFGWIAAAVLVLDRISKIFAPRIPAEGAALIPGVIGLRYAENTGMAFSLFSGRPWLLGVLSLVVILGAFLYLRHKKIPRLPGIGLMLMLGGAAGNMFDRFITGYVPDMIEFLFVQFAVFNVADMGLTIGCVLVILGLFQSGNGAWEEARKAE